MCTVSHVTWPGRDVKLLKSIVPECLRSSVVLLSDKEEEAYELCPLLAERKDENSCLLHHHHFGCRFVNSVRCREGS